jgi:hypothetical protein
MLHRTPEAECQHPITQRNPHCFFDRFRSLLNCVSWSFPGIVPGLLDSDLMIVVGDQKFQNNLVDRIVFVHSGFIVHCSDV